MKLIVSKYIYNRLVELEPSMANYLEVIEYVEDPEDLVDAVIAGDPNGPSETYLEVMKNLEEKFLKLKEKRNSDNNHSN